MHALHLRQSGGTYRAIAMAMLGDPAWRGRLPRTYDARKVHADVVAAMQQMQHELGEVVAEVRTLELARLDQLHLAVWGRAIQGDYGAIDTVLKIMARRAKFLPGLEAPQAVAPVPWSASSTDRAPAPNDVDVEEVARQLAAYGLSVLASRDDRTEDP